MKPRILSLILLILVGMPQKSIASQGDYVVVLHGIARSAGSMKKMVSHLTDHGYETLNINYPSTKLSLENLVEYINREVLSFNLDFNRKICFVSYSMGGLLVRGLLSKYPPKNLGRVVMLAPPNLGSEATDFWKEKWIYKKVYGPAGQQLTTDQSGLKNFFGKIDYDLGIIAGDRSIDPFHSLIIPGTDDGKVSIERTKAKGMKDHLVIHATHTFIMNNKKALHQTTNFLAKGKFSRP